MTQTRKEVVTRLTLYTCDQCGRGVEEPEHAGRANLPSGWVRIVLEHRKVGCLSREYCGVPCAVHAATLPDPWGLRDAAYDAAQP